MPCTKKTIYFILSHFLYLSVFFDFRSDGQLIGSSCNSTKKQFLPDKEQNAGFSCPGIPHLCTGDTRYYAIDGSCNNLQHPRWGSTGSPYVRLVAASYSDGVMEFRKSSDGSPLPNPREISTTLFTDKNILSNNYNILFYGFAQWVDHDMSLSVPQVSPIPCCAGIKPEPNPPKGLCMPIYPTSNDPYFSKYKVTCIDTKRSVNTATLGCPLKPIDQINFQTSWIDMSLIYGPSALLTGALRTFKGGQLKIANVKQPNGQTFPPIIPIGCPVGGLEPIPGGACLAAGDPRLAQNSELTVNAVVLFRMHNHIASGLQKANPEWNDNMLFNEARKILIAKYQHVIYAEMVPAIIGTSMAESYKLLPLKSGYATGYNSALNGQHLAEFSASAGRILHSMVRATTFYKDSLGKMKKYSLQEKFFNQRFLLQGNTFTNIVESFGKTQCGAQDQFVSTDITDRLFISTTHVFGQDLVSVDINRGRDFGVASYNTYRKACGLCQLNSFQDLQSVINNPTENIPILERLYKNVNDIDLYVAGMLEKPVPGGTVGPTIACLFAELFYRAKFADRLFYEFQSSGFTEPQLQDIRKTTYSQFLCLTNNITSITAESLFVPSAKNPDTPCPSFGDTNYNLFKTT